MSAIPGEEIKRIAGAAKDNGLYVALGLFEREGDSIPVASTPFGTMAFLICGDNSFDQERWDKEEKDAYAKRAAMTGATALMVNQLGGDHESGNSFGVAWVMSREVTPAIRCGHRLASLV